MAPTLNNAVRRIRTSGANPATAAREYRWHSDWFSNKAGRQITASQARSMPAVGRAVNIVAGTIASFPLHIFEASESGERRLAQDDSTRILWRQPNPEVPPFVFWRVIAAHKVLRENAYIFVVKDNGGRPLELWPINPTRVRVGRLDDGRKVFEVDNETAMLSYKDGGEIVHVVGDTEDGLVGIGPLERYGTTFELGIMAEEYASRMFSQDSTPGGLLKTSQELTQERAEELLARWELRHAGPDRFRRPAVLTNGLEWQTVQFNPEESQMIESRRFSIGEISRIFGVPPHLLADVERSTSWGAGLEEQGLQFLRTLTDHTAPIEQTITMNFLPEDRFALFNADAVLRADTLARHQAHEIALRSRFKTPNEVRRLENLPPIEGGDELAAPPNASISPPPPETPKGSVENTAPRKET